MTQSFWASALMAQSAAVTIAMRLPMFYEAATNPRAKAARDETYRATTEKMDAMVESLAAANVAAFGMWMNIWMRPGDPSVVTRGVNAIVKAAEKPVSRRVHSNAKRLTRGK
ncbi:MAG: hypothetical protein ACRCYS_12410 [Beijerinckiaceae bacterium]